MIAKQHFSMGRQVLAICDDDILGKKIEEGEQILDMTSQFYKGEAMEEQAFMELLPKLYLINAVGKKTIDMLINKDIVDKDTPKTIGGVPYVHVVFEEPKN